jgi:hypothetical protein
MPSRLSIAHPRRHRPSLRMHGRGSCSNIRFSDLELEYRLSVAPENFPAFGHKDVNGCEAKIFLATLRRGHPA